ncbi:MAG: FG-GAP-like repeat-containing protein [Permianibacter sp.]
MSLRASFVRKSLPFCVSAALFATIMHASAADKVAADGLYQIVVGDFDGDQMSDIIRQGRTRREQHSAVLAAVQQASVQRWQDGYLDTAWNQNAAQLVVGDFNGDASSDILVQGGNPLATATIVHAYLDGRLGMPAQTIADWHLGLRWDAAHHRIFAADLNGDGKDDLVLQGATSADRHAVALADDKGLFNQLALDFDNYHFNRDWSWTSTTLATGDFDGNGRHELLLQPATGDQSTLIVGSDQRAMLNRIQTEVPAQHLNLDWSSGRHRAVVGDFNGDGKDDVFLLAAHVVEQSAYLPSSDAGFERIDKVIERIPYLEQLKQVLVGDFDADGIDDLVLLFNDPNIAPMLLLADAARAARLAGFLRKLGLLTQGQTLAVTEGQAPRGAVDGHHNNWQSADVRSGQGQGKGRAVSSSASSSKSSNVSTKLSRYTAMTAPVSTEFGMSGGQFRVDESGAATFTIPIVVAPGSGGVAPTLSLRYSSQAANGPLGMGWQLAGLSAISRCRATKEADGFDNDITFTDSDKFCFDGQRLLEVSSSSGKWVYRTEIDTFAKVTAYGAAKGHPERFVVEKKDGSISYFGSKDPAAVEQDGSRVQVAGGSHDAKVMSWAISRFEDSVGNYINYLYYKAGGEHRISSVRYGGVGRSHHSEVIFSYEDRPDKRTLYAYGGTVKNPVRLSKIRSTSGSTEQRSYKLFYNNTGATENSRMEYIQECRGTACLPAIKFDWLQNDAPAVWTRPSNTGSVFSHRYTSSKVSDFNGDGDADLAWVTRDSEGKYFWVKTWVKDPAGGNEYFTATSTNIPLPRKGQNTWHLFDYNGDGRTDMLFRPCKQIFPLNQQCTEWGGKWVIALANADGSLPSPSVNGSTVTFPTYIETGIGIVNGEESESSDFNGDGLPDLLFPSSATNRKEISVSLLRKPGQDGHVCASPSSAMPYCYGVPIKINLEVTSPYSAWSSSFRCGEPLPSPRYRGIALDSSERASLSVMDMNGDSAADLVVNAEYLVSEWDEQTHLTHCDAGLGAFTTERVSVKRVFLSKLNQGINDFQEAESYAEVLDRVRSLGDDLIRFTDMNGDGLTDLFHALGDQSWRAILNNGQGFVGSDRYYSVTGTSSDVYAKKRLMTVDLNTDGLPDVVYPHSGYYYVAYQQGDASFSVPTSSGARAESAGDRQDVFGDFNGDGKLDIVELFFDSEGNNHSSQQMQLFGNAGRAHNVISKITLPTGAVTNVEYKPLTDPAIYSRAPALSKVSGRGSPVFDVFGPMYVVSRVNSSAPTAAPTPMNVDHSATAAIQYRYVGLKMQAGGRGSLGFRSIITTDEQTGVVTQTDYEQAFPYTGMPLRTRKTTTNGILISDAVNQLTTYRTMTGAATDLGGDFPYIRVSTETTRDIHGDSVSGFLSRTVTTTEYDRYGNVTEVKVEDRASTSGSTNLRVKTTRNTFGTTHDEGFYGRLTWSTVTTERPGLPSETRTTEFRYGPYRQLQEEIIEPNGSETDYARTVYGFDTFGNRNRVTVCSIHVASCGTDFSQQPNNPYFVNRTSRTEYDVDGRLAVKKWNHYGQLVEELLSWHDTFQPLMVKGATGVIKTFRYSDFGRLEREHDNTGSTGAWTETRLKSCTEVSCVPGAAYRIETLSSGKPTSYQHFDRLGREIATQVDSLTQRASGYLTVYTEYDHLSRIKRVSVPHFSHGYGSAVPGWKENRYDILGRLEGVKSPDPLVPEATTEYLGLKTTHTNQMGQRKVERRNALGELVEVIDNEAGAGVERAVITYQYDVQGQLAKLFRVNSTNLQSQLGYDIRGRKISMWDADKSLSATGWTYKYNAVGELIQQVDARGYVTDNRYDAMGRLIARTESSNTGVVLSSASWNYEREANKAGLLLEDSVTVKVSDTGATSPYKRTYRYDTLGRPTHVEHLFEGRTTPYVESTEYDPVDGRVVVKRDITGKGLRYVYSASNYLNEVQDADNSAIVFQRIQEMDAYGNITRESLGNGAVITRMFKPLTGRLSDVVTTRGANIQNLHYEWDHIGNLKLRRDSSGGKSVEESFTYDGLNRLSRAYAGAPDKEIVTTYDAEGNIKAKSDVASGNYSYGETCNGIAAGPHAVSSVVTASGTKTYCYDKNGNMVSGDGRTLTYDNTFDLPTKIVGGNHTTFYTYGIDHARFKRVDRKAGEPETVVWYVGSVEIVKKTDGSTEFRRAIPNGIVSNGTPTYILKDHIGSTDVILDCVGKVIEAHSFDAWGKQRNVDTWKLRGGMWAAAWPAEMLPKSPMLSPRTHAKTFRGFTGHEMVDELGLIHMNGRMYDPHLGRFLQADPLIQAPTMSQSLNRYSYIINNPLSGTDPSGFSWWMEHRDRDIRPVVAVIVAAVMTYFGCASCGKVAWGMIVGAVSGAIATGTVRGAFNGALSGAVFAYIGVTAQANGWGNGAYLAAHAMAGGVLAELQGGKFGHGFIAAGLTKASSIGVNSNIVVETIVAAVVSGTVTEMTGGKFANGALTGAFQYLLNEYASGQSNGRENCIGDCTQVTLRDGSKIWVNTAIAAEVVAADQSGSTLGEYSKTDGETIYRGAKVAIGVTAVSACGASGACSPLLIYAAAATAYDGVVGENPAATTARATAFLFGADQQGQNNAALCVGMAHDIGLGGYALVHGATNTIMLIGTQSSWLPVLNGAAGTVWDAGSTVYDVDKAARALGGRN